MQSGVAKFAKNMQKINKVKLRKNENMYCEETQIVTTHENFITDQMIKKKEFANPVLS